MLKLAIVHDFLHQLGGAERVLESFHELYPGAPVYTLLYDPRKVPYRAPDWDIRPHPLANRLLLKRFYTLYWPIFPKLVEGFKLDGYDIVLSSSYAWVKSLKTRALHICYCYTPPRFLYELFDEYVKRYPPWLKKVIWRQKEKLRAWDQATAGRPDHYIAISRHVANRIKDYYGREAEVIYPPVDTDYFTPAESAIGPPDKTSDYFLVVSRLTPYKRIDLAVAAFNQLGWPLIIIGSGPEAGRLKKMAKDNIIFLGRQEDDVLLAYYRNCRALIFPGEEDFGIVPVEAQACGRPVIAYAKGGALETVVDGQTGLFFEEATAASLIAALARFTELSFDPGRARQNSLNFSRPVFFDKIKTFLAGKYRLFQADPNKV